MNKLKQAGVKIEFTNKMCTLYYNGNYVAQSSDIDYILRLAELKRQHKQISSDNYNVELW